MVNQNEIGHMMKGAVKLHSFYEEIYYECINCMVVNVIKLTLAIRNIRCSWHRLVCTNIYQNDLQVVMSQHKLRMPKNIRINVSNQTKKRKISYVAQFRLNVPQDFNFIKFDYK